MENVNPNSLSIAVLLIGGGAIAVIGVWAFIRSFRRKK